MPSIYAHYRFGNDTFKALPEYLRTQISDRGLFDIGLSGPDIFFYYKPLSHNSINAIGHETHKITGTAFFEKARAAYLSADDKSATLSYLLGVVCHFALDSACHGYIEKKIQVSGVSHTEIESEFERYLMLKDGLDPVRHILTGHIIPDRASAAVIAPCFPPAVVQDVEKALKSIIFYQRLLYAPSKWKRSFLRGALKAAGHKEMAGHVIPAESSDGCLDSNVRLFKLYQNAVTSAVAMTDNLFHYLRDDAPLCDSFRKTFGPDDNWQEIPVLPYTEELMYEI